MLSTADLVRPPMPIAAPKITSPAPMARRSEKGCLTAAPPPAGAPAPAAAGWAWAETVPWAISNSPRTSTADLTSFIGPLTPGILVVRLIGGEASVAEGRPARAGRVPLRPRPAYNSLRKPGDGPRPPSRQRPATARSVRMHRRAD